MQSLNKPVYVRIRILLLVFVFVDIFTTPVQSVQSCLLELQYRSEYYISQPIYSSTTADDLYVTTVIITLAAVDRLTDRD